MNNKIIRFHKGVPNTKPRVSVITIVYEGFGFIENTIKSVIEQSYTNLEYIIIDGDSSDGTQNVIKEYEDKIDFWLSEKDKGIYDAMNKGIKYATGDWINFMNAGDSFCDHEVIQSISSSLNENVDVLVGNTIVLYDNNYSKIQEGKIKDFRFGLPFCHQSSFVRASLIKEVKFDLSYKVYSDLVTYYELLKSGAKYKYVNRCISKFDYNGLSSQFNIKPELEKLRFGKKNFDFYPLQFAIYLFNKSIRALLKNILPYKIVRKIQVSK